MSQTKKRTLTLLLIIILIAIPFISYGAWVKYGSKPLDDEGKLTYIGRRESGCWYILCIDKQVDEFYYATDISLDELKSNYFNEAKFESENYDGQSAGKQFWSLTFLNEETNEKFYIRYYPDGRKRAEEFKLDLKGRSSLVLLINRPNYDIVKKSL